MIKTTFDIGEVADAVSFWIPGFRCGDATQNVSAGDHAEYRLRCTRNELIDDFEVAVEAVSDTEARVTVTGMDGRSAEGIFAGVMGNAASLTIGMLLSSSLERANADMMVVLIVVMAALLFEVAGLAAFLFLKKRG